MRTSWKTLAAVAASLVFVPQLAGADEVAEQLKLMQDRMSQLEDRLQATNDQLQEAEAQVSEQQVVIQEAGLGEERGAQSALSSFLSDTEFGGAVAASYFWNTENPGFGTPGSLGPIGNPFHNHNTFQLDQLSLSARRTADKAHTAGFGFEMMYGATAGVVGNGIVNDAGNGGNTLWISQAFVEYNTGLMGDNTVVTAGIFPTHIGYEVADAQSNVNITRGFTYNLFQPISQIGVKVSGGEGGFSWMIGGVNGFAPNQLDTDRGKDLIGSVGYGNDMFSVSANVEWGTDAQSRWGKASPGVAGSVHKTKILVLDFVGEITPTEDLVAWVDLTYLSALLNSSSAGDPYGVGVSVGSRYAFTDKWGLGGRFEYAHIDSKNSGFVFFTGQTSNSIDLYSFTLTTDYALADGLVLKVEGQYQAANRARGTLVPTAGGGGSNNIFPSNTAKLRQDQLIFGAQMVYSF